MCRVLGMSGFWIIQDFEHARVLNFQGHKGNMHCNPIMEKFWIFQDSDYARLLHMQALHIWLRIIPVETVLTMAGFWIYVFNVSQGFEHTSVSKHARAQNMASLWIWEGCSGCWIYLNKPEYALMMLQYMLW